LSDIVLVTGASRGIGASIAEAYARRPDTIVLINYHSDEEGAERTLETVRSLGAQGSCYQADVAEADDVAEMANRISTDYGRPLTTLVNNVGQIVRPSGWLEISPNDLQRTIAVNLLSVFWTIRSFAPAMIEAKKGHIVNLCTTYAINGAAPVLSYTAAKAGVAAITTAMAAELGQHGIRVNAVAPGNIDTEMTRSAGADVVQWSIETTPLGRLGATHEVAEAVEFLEDSAFVTGEIIKVDGGQILKI